MWSDKKIPSSRKKMYNQFPPVLFIFVCFGKPEKL